MKKFAFLLFVLLPLLNSCSGDSDGENSNGLLVKKITSTSGGGSVYITNFFYNGTKLDHITASNRLIEYTYTGDLITEIRQYYGSDLGVKSVFEYDGNERVVREITYSYFMDSSEKKVYTYNTDNTISYMNYSGDISNQNTLQNTGKIFNFSNGETYRIQIYDLSGNMTFKTEWTYDAKKCPFLYVTGFAKQPTVFSKYFNNTMTSNYDGSGVVTSSATYQYTYNSSDFPVECIENYYYSGSLSNTNTINYFY